MYYNEIIEKGIIMKNIFKKILIKTGIMSYFILAPLAMSQAIADPSGIYYYKINNAAKNSLKIVTTPMPSGRRVSWGNCSGLTTKELNKQGEECEVINNDTNGYTGTTEVCANPVGEPLLNNSSCYQDCSGTTLSWSSGQCSGTVTAKSHNQAQTITNVTTQYTGSGTFICEDGTWREQTSTCTENESVCGSDNGLTLAGTPTNLCDFGTASSVTQTATGYNWSCTNVAKTVSCSANKSPVCDNSIYQGCTTGTASAYTSAIGASTVTWNCSNGSQTVACSKSAVVGIAGVCGADNGTIKGATPTNLCSSGTASTVTQASGKYNWSCNGEVATATRTKGADVSCTADQLAVCDNTTFKGCTLGTASEYTSANGDINATWTCTNNSSVVNCSKSKGLGISGVCGSSNGGTFASAPSSGLCSSSNGASSVSRSGSTFSWTCYGSSANSTTIAGSNTGCSATAQEWTATSPTCGAAYDKGSATCGSYNPTPTTQTTSFTQTQSCSIGQAQMCQGREYETYTGTYRNVGSQYEQNLSARSYTNTRTVTVSWSTWSTYNTSCGSWTPSTGSYAQGETFTQSRTCSYDQSRTRSYSSGESFGETRTLSNQTETRSATGTQTASCNNGTYGGCSVGSFSGYTSGSGASTVTWSCSHGTSSASCSRGATSGTNGVCGSANGGTFASAPSSGLCSSGTPSGVSGTTSYSWTCFGSSGTQTSAAGSNASCSATGANWVSIAPSCGAAYDTGTASCGSWSPSATTQTSSFGQTQSCTIGQARTCQAREQDTVSGNVRNVGGTYTETLANRSYPNNRTVTVSDSGWVNSGGTYGCYGYTPDPSTVNSGTQFTQNGYCKQNQTATVTYSIGGSYQYGSRTIDVNHSRQATGTKQTEICDATYEESSDPISSSASYSYPNGNYGFSDYRDCNGDNWSNNWGTYDGRYYIKSLISSSTYNINYCGGTSIGYTRVYLLCRAN